MKHDLFSLDEPIRKRKIFTKNNPFTQKEPLGFSVPHSEWRVGDLVYHKHSKIHGRVSAVSVIGPTTITVKWVSGRVETFTSERLKELKKVA